MSSIDYGGGGGGGDRNDNACREFSEDDNISVALRLRADLYFCVSGTPLGRDHENEMVSKEATMMTAMARTVMMNYSLFVHLADCDRRSRSHLHDDYGSPLLVIKPLLPASTSTSTSTPAVMMMMMTTMTMTSMGSGRSSSLLSFFQPLYG